MYTKTKSCVRLGNQLSHGFSILKGVSKGDILSPLLFNLFVNDMVQEFHQNDADAPTLETLATACLLYADDLVLISTTPEGL